MSEFLIALGYDPRRYWLLAGACSGLWLLSCFLPFDPKGSVPRRASSPLLYGALLLATMIAFRWPAVCFYVPVNPDESNFLAGALTMFHRHEFWWSDTMSSGPLVMLPLVLPAVIGMPVDYTTGRVVALLLSWGVAGLVYLILRHVHGDRLARLLSLPLACFVILLHYWDFTAYVSEWPPLFLCTLAAWLCLSSFRSDGTLERRGRLAVGGLVLGIVPFSKLQALPIGAVVVATAGLLVWRQPGLSRRAKTRDLTLLLAVIAGAFLFFILWAWSSGNGRHVYEAYPRFNLAYYLPERDVPWLASFSELRYLGNFSWGFAAYHNGMLLLLLAGFVAVFRLPKPAWTMILFSWCLLAAAYYAVIAPGRPYMHYLIFLTMPLGLAVGLPWGYWIRQPTLRRPMRIGLLALLLLAGAGGQVVERLHDRVSRLTLVTSARSRAAAVKLVRKLKRPGDTLAVWGWRPELYVETQLAEAARDAQTEYFNTPQRDYFRSTFLADLHASRPAFFIDAVGPGGYDYQKNDRHGLETFAELSEYVGRHYQLLREVDSFRVYLRLDRLPAETVEAEK